MNKLTRKEMKSDKFALEVQHSVAFVSEHRQQMIRWGITAAVVVVLGFSFYFYWNHMRDVREEALRSALQIQNANVGPAASSQALTFPTADARTKAVIKAWTDLVSKYPGTQEAYMGHYYLGTTAADGGNMAEAEKQFRIVADGASAPYASVAKVALAQVLGSEGKLAEGEKILQSVIDHPTVLVSKDSATLALVDLIKNTDPARARKLLEPLRTSTRSAVSKAAINEYGELTQK
ncbi:MAG TPA: tetratricopeptide repeat protein [Bryobacteraceae bacterium]|nr:tetratricopeptide repeat protein [Bryobacteraceae bacterium]